MPATEVRFWAETDGTSQVVTWLQELRAKDRQGFAKCVARIKQLAMEGHELRRPAAEFLRDGICELRAKKGHVQYRLLYFFHGKNVAIVAHGIVKPGSAVPPEEIARARQRKTVFEHDPIHHAYEGEITDE